MRHNSTFSGKKLRPSGKVMIVTSGKPRRELSNEHRQETSHAGETNEKLRILIFVHMAPQGFIDQTDAPFFCRLFTMNSQDCTKEGAG